MTTDNSLGSSHIPDSWLNIASLISGEYPLPLSGEDKKPVTLEWLSSRYSLECAKIELLKGTYRNELHISIPGAVMDEYMKYRPTPLSRARGFEKYLEYEGKIFFKREDYNPTGSHKPNTAIPQAWYAKKENLKQLITDTGAGQWGAALAMACRSYGLDCTVFMTRNSYMDKPYRRYLMELLGAEVYSSPSNKTVRGRKLLEQDPDHYGSLGIGMGEAIDLVQHTPGSRLALGCMSYYAAMHQTVVGQELEIQMQHSGIEPDLLVACVGGGTNLFGFMSTYLIKAFKGQKVPTMIAAESANVPVLTRGEYRYDFADSFKLTHLLKMYTLGHDFIPPKIHAGGLRYHGKSTILSLMVHKGLIKPVAIPQEECFRAGQIFLKCEGVLPAPESNHAIAAVMRAVEHDRASGIKRNIVFCLSGTGYLDLVGYARQFGLRL